MARIVLLFLAISLFSCVKPGEPKPDPDPADLLVRTDLLVGLPVKTDLLVRLFSNGESRGNRRDHILQIEHDDDELRRISFQARSDFPAFVRKLQNPAPGEGNFRVKYPFPADEGSGFRYEELWLRNITFKDGSYRGIIASQPFYIGRLRLGDWADFYGDGISDWMYEQNGRISGGASVKYLIERIPEMDRDAALSAWYERFSSP